MIIKNIKDNQDGTVNVYFHYKDEVDDIHNAEYDIHGYITLVVDNDYTLDMIREGTTYKVRTIVNEDE